MLHPKSKIRLRRQTVPQGVKMQLGGGIIKQIETNKISGGMTCRVHETAVREREKGPGDCDKWAVTQ